VNRSAEFKHTVWAVGPDVPTALATLGSYLGWSSVTGIVYGASRDMLHTIEEEWDAMFQADGKPCKASGQYVRGGVIITWWRQDPFPE